MKRLLIIGSGDLGQLIAHHAIADNQYEVVGFLDDYAEKNTFIMGIQVLGNLSDITHLDSEGVFDVLLLGIGYNHMEKRKTIFEQLNKDFHFATLIHSNAYVDPSVQLGDGVFILPGCTIDAYATIGNNVLLNTGCTIAHDTSIENHCFLSPSVSIAGKSKVNECCVIGINSTVIDNITINANVRVGAGAVVVNDLIEKGTYVGVPAKLKL